ncbi:MAG: hypothetical protein IVW57_12560 [Ktedonobacterales bacterium]|nr:hypothetical protein [Ktedonobacterales bacterium]
MRDIPRSSQHGSPIPFPSGPHAAQRRGLGLPRDDEYALQAEPPVEDERAPHADTPYADTPYADTPYADTSHPSRPSHAALPRLDAPGVSPASGRPPRGGMSRVSLRLPRRPRAPDPWDAYARDDQPWEMGTYQGQSGPDVPSDSGIRARERTTARPLTAKQTAVARAPTRPAARLIQADALPTDSVPDLMAFHPSRRLPPRAVAHTRAVLRKASRPWSVARLVIALATIIIALLFSLSAAGEPPVSALAYQTSAGSAATKAIVENVTPLTQITRCDEYDSYAQCQQWGGAACSAAVLAELFTAWGMPNMTIGRMISELGADISPDAGLLNRVAFQRVAGYHSFRADLSNSYTYNQILYVVNTMRVPLVIDVRISYGYFHFLSGGHFLTVTGGDSQGLRIVDSSLYRIRYLPRDVFYSMFTGGTALFLPQGYAYTLPAI